MPLKYWQCAVELVNIMKFFRFLQ